MADRPSSETLLTAYVDGVGELAVEERRRVERFLSDPAVRAEQEATRDLLDQLRALPDETAQVDWAAMERAIHAEVGDEVPKRSWFHRWRFAVPAFVLAGVAATLFLVVRSHDDDDDVSPIAFVPNPVPDIKLPMFEHLDDRVTVYLDGTDLEIAADDADELDAELAALELDEVTLDDVSIGFLEPSDLAWIDDLDDDALTRAEKALAQPIKLRKGI